jgi:hypothetical protein
VETDFVKFDDGLAIDVAEDADAIV